MKLNGLVDFTHWNHSETWSSHSSPETCPSIIPAQARMLVMLNYVTADDLNRFCTLCQSKILDKKLIGSSVIYAWLSNQEKPKIP